MRNIRQNADPTAGTVKKAEKQSNLFISLRPFF
jgi:hypothetical protein